MSTNALGKAALFGNAHSRHGEEWFPLVRQKLVEQGFELVASESFDKPAKLLPAVQKAVKEKVPLIIVGGGDGTLSSASAALKGSSSVLGVMPFGTANAFAHDLGIPIDPNGACQVLVEGFPCDIDLGIAGGQHFVNVATVGLTTRIAEEIKHTDKRRWGVLVYGIAIARAVGKAKPFRATLVKPDGTDEFETMQIVFGSGRFHAGPFPVTPDAQLTDHVLHGYALKTKSKGTLLKFAFSLWGGHHVNLPEVETFDLTNAKLSTTPIQRVVVDGEIVKKTPIEIQIDPGAVRVMTPKDFKSRTHGLIR